MDIDANVQKIIQLLLRKWKLLLVFAIIGALIAYGYTARFTTPVYTSQVEFLATAVDPDYEMESSTSSVDGDNLRTSNTSKMNYALKMLDTYIEIFQTTSFYQDVATEMNKTYNSTYNGATLSRSVTIEPVENTAMFIMTITTSSADLSYNLAKQLEISVPQRMENTNDGLVKASVEDPPIRATNSSEIGYAKRCAIGAAAGLVLAALYVILRDLLDVRIKSTDNLSARYNIPVLGSVPDFGRIKTDKSTKKAAADKKKGVDL